MEFIPAKCPNCSGELMLPEKTEHAICSYCGSKFLLKDALPKPPLPSIENWLTIANHALISKNYVEALDYSNRILEVDLENRIAWSIKGCSTGYLSTADQPRILEMTTAFERAIELSPAHVRMNNVISTTSKCHSVIEHLFHTQLEHMIECLVSTPIQTNEELARKNSEWEKVKSYYRQLSIGLDFILKHDHSAGNTALLAIDITNAMISVSKHHHYTVVGNWKRIEKSRDTISGFEKARAKYGRIAVVESPSVKLAKPASTYLHKLA